MYIYLDIGVYKVRSRIKVHITWIFEVIPGYKVGFGIQEYKGILGQKYNRGTPWV